MFKILFVDDEFLVLEGLKKIINWEDYNIQIVGAVTNAKEAVEIVKKQTPDIIITDVKMRNMDGIEMLKQIKENGYTGYMIILSGYSEFKYAQRAIERGVYRYLLKPLDIQQLSDLMREITNELEKKRDFLRLNEKTIEKAVTYIKMHFDEEISLSKLAEMYSFDISYFSRLFKKRVGMTYSEYIVKLRIDKAKEYLKMTDYSVEQIATIVGYKDDKYFRELFKKHENVSPAKYRNKEQDYVESDD